jgi:hypothetical protein
MMVICSNNVNGCQDLKDTIVHELTHARQLCDAGGGNPWDTPLESYEEGVCRELEAFQADGSCDANANAPDFYRNCLCVRACNSYLSAVGMLDPWNMNRCTNRCIHGYYARCELLCGPHTSGRMTDEQS